MVGLCRLCASLRKSDLLTAVKDNSSEICDKLRKCCQIEISMDDDLPKSVCQECISNLNSSHKFYTKVQEAQETLQALYPSRGNKFVQIPIHQTLQAQAETLLSAGKKSEVNDTRETENIVEDDIFEESANFVNELNTENGKELEKSYKNVEELNICEIPISEESCEILERSSNTDDIHQIEQKQREDNLRLNQNGVQYDLGISEKDSQSKQVIQQLNDLLSDDEVNVEIEYVDCWDDEEEDNYEDDCKEIEETLGNKTEKMNKTLIFDKINSWKKYKYLCFICDTMFNAFVDLKSHIAEEHKTHQLDKLKYKCYDCRKIITRYSFFLNHVRAVHHPGLKLKCDACDLSCQNFNELTHHRSIDCVEAKNFVTTTGCSYCFKTFNNSYGLQNHIKFQHTTTSKIIYKCELCAKEFRYKSCLKSHERLHSDKKLFSCDYCDKSFHTKLGLEQHLYTHVEEKAFPCNICNRSYKTFQSLDDHKKLHTEEKAFKCQFCSKVFSRKIQKLTHERSHTGEMPYSCEQCNKRFRYRSALFVHNKIHTGYKPYSCDYCAKVFADSSNRNKHVRRMHLRDNTLDNKIE